MRATWRSTFTQLLALAGDLICWARHTHEDCGLGRALCPCGREWQGRLLRSRDWRADCYDITSELWAGEAGARNTEAAYLFPPGLKL